MSRVIAACCALTASVFLATANPNPAAAQAQGDEFIVGQAFDGAAAVSPDALALPKLGHLEKSAAMKSRAKKESSDLYYFTPEEAAEAARAFAFVAESARGYKFDANVPAEIQKQMRDDLAFIRGIQGGGTSGLHQQIFGSVDGAAYTQFFESRVKSIGMNGCGNGNAVACVIPMMGPSKMWLTQNYIKFSHAQVARMMVVFHESRHTELRHGNWPHASCPDPFLDAAGNDMKSIWTGAMLAGEPACDKTPLGSYGSSMIMLKNIQKFCTNCTDKVKMDAGIYADDQLNRVIDPKAKKQIQDDLYR